MSFESAKRTAGVWWWSNAHFLLPALGMMVVAAVAAVVGWWAGVLLLLGLGGLLYRAYLVSEFGEEAFKTDADREEEERTAERLRRELIEEEEKEEAKRRAQMDKKRRKRTKGPKPKKPAGKTHLDDQTDAHDSDEDPTDRLARRALERDPKLRAKFGSK